MKRADEGGAAPGPDVAAYIEEMSRELGRMAEAANFPVLAHLLNLAREGAFEIGRNEAYAGRPAGHAAAAE